MRKAIVKDSTGEVINVIVLNDGDVWTPPLGHLVVDASDSGSPGDHWDGSVVHSAVVEVFRDNSGAVRYRREAPLGTVIEEREATDAESAALTEREIAEKRRVNWQDFVHGVKNAPADAEFKGPLQALLGALEGESGLGSEKSLLEADRVSLAVKAIAGVPIRLRSVSQSGLAGYTLRAVVSDPRVARIVGAVFPAAFPLNSQKPNPVSGSTVLLSAVDLGSAVNAGDLSVLLVTVQVEGLVRGFTSLKLQVTRFDDDGGFPLETVSLDGGIEVT